MLIDFRELFPKYNIKPKEVLHVGANVGEEMRTYYDLGIKTQWWIEAEPVTFYKLKTNAVDFMAINMDARIYCHNACISDEENKEVIFHVSNNGSQSSSILELGTHKIAHPEVVYKYDLKMTTRRLDNLLLNQFAMMPTMPSDYFLNMDLQGAELLALKGMGILLGNFKWAYLEVNKEELYKGCALVEDIDFYLASFGFQRVETKWAGNTGWGDALYIIK